MIRTPIKEESGVIVFDVSSDEGNDDWLRTKRLLDKGKDDAAKKRFDTELYDEEY